MALIKNKMTKTSRFAIERDIQKQREPIEKDIQSLKKGYDVILSTAQKSFEQNEKAHYKALEKLKTTHVKDTREQNQSLEKELSSAKNKLKSMQFTHDRTMDDHLKSFKEKHDAINDAIKTIENDRARTLNAIEEKHKETTLSYEEKINIYKQSLENNKRHHTNTIEKAISTLKDAYSKEKKALNNLEETLTQDFSTIENSINEKVGTLKEDLKQEKNTIEYQINAMRKSLNDLLRDVKKHLYTVASTIKTPFEFNRNILDDLHAFYKDIETEFTTKVEYDVKSEIHRLTELNKTPDDSEDSEEQSKAINELTQKQIELNTLRQNALTSHSEQKLKLLDASFKMYDESLTNLNQKIKHIFDTHESLIESQISRFKKVLDIFQSSATSNDEKLSSITDLLTNTNVLSPFKTLFNHVFKALHAFEQERISALRQTLNTLKPFYEEIDEIRYYIDTKDARKEIEINKQRIEVEQKDAALNKEMDVTKKTHDQTLLKIEHDHFITEQKALFSIDYEKQTQTINDLLAYKHAYNDRLKHNFDKKQADLELDLRKKQAEVDKKQIIDRQAIEETILKHNSDLSKLDALKTKNLKLEDLNDTTHAEKQRLTLKVNEYSVQIKRIEEMIKQREERIERQLEQQRDQLKETHLSKKSHVDEELKNLEKDYRGQLDFIDKAYQIETTKAKNHIDYIESIKTNQLTPIKEAYLSHKKSLLTHLKSIEDYTQNDCIQLLHPTFKTPLITHINDTFRARLTASEFSENQQIDLLKESDLKKRKRDSKIQKLKTQFRTLNKHINDQWVLTKNSVESILETPQKTLEKKGSVTLKTFKSLIHTMIQSLKDSLDSTYQDFDASLTDLYAPLTTKETQLLDKADKSRIEAKRKAETKYQDALSPLNEKLKTLEHEYKTQLNDLESKIKAEKLKAIGDLYEKENALKESIESYSEALNNMTSTIESKQETIETNTQNSLKMIDDIYNQDIKELKEKYQSQFDKIEERLDKAKDIHSQTTINAENALESIESVLSDTQAYNKENFTYIKKKAERTLETSKQEKEEKIHKAQTHLTNKLNEFEEQILTSKARLEEQMEHVSRKIDDEISIKSTKMAQLKDAVNEKETALYNSFEEAFESLNKKLQTAFTTLDDSTKSDATMLDEFIQQQNDTSKAFIKATIDSIKST